MGLCWRCWHGDNEAVSRWSPGNLMEHFCLLIRLARLTARLMVNGESIFWCSLRGSCKTVCQVTFSLMFIFFLINFITYLKFIFLSFSSSLKSPTTYFLFFLNQCSYWLIYYTNQLYGINHVFTIIITDVLYSKLFAIYIQKQIKTSVCAVMTGQWVINTCSVINSYNLSFDKQEFLKFSPSFCIRNIKAGVIFI